jgi:hypothetical protein
MRPPQTGGHGEKVRPILPPDVLRIDEADAGFVDQGGGLKAVASPLVGHAASRDAVQFSVHQRTSR